VRKGTDNTTILAQRAEFASGSVIVPRIVCCNGGCRDRHCSRHAFQKQPHCAAKVSSRARSTARTRREQPVAKRRRHEIRNEVKRSTSPSTNSNSDCRGEKCERRSDSDGCYLIQTMISQCESGSCIEKDIRRACSWLQVVRLRVVTPRAATAREQLTWPGPRSAAGKTANAPNRRHFVYGLSSS